MDLGLAGKTVLVTGAARGLGRAIGMAFAGEGASVAFHYHRSQDDAEDAARAATKQSVKAIAVKADLRDAAEVRRAIDVVETELAPPEILVNAASVGTRQRFLETSEDDWRPDIDVTIYGTLNVVQAAARSMAAHTGGSIVTLLGDSGRIGESGLVITATTRSSMLGMTKAMAKEFARDSIRVNGVSIALVETEATRAFLGPLDETQTKAMLSHYPLRRLGTVDDITPTVLLLASPRSSWTTGQVFSVNGGFAMV
jgi:2-hydroxycyclohexanecarboxyl-CoA dehydrogenase